MADPMMDLRSLALTGAAHGEKSPGRLVQRANLELHQTFGGKGDHLAQKIDVGRLLHAVQRALYITLESFAPVSDDPLVGLPAAAA